MTTRVAAYCRVSTDQRDQINSFQSQKLFFQKYIDGRSDWELAEIYTDEGITGTTTADRTGFLKMIDDAQAGKFNLILTKEVSRFSRNILDAVAYTRLLKKKGVAVVFMNDGISTAEPDAELRLGIMASVAQEESRKTSERVKWGQRRKMERGVVFGRNLLGYEVRNGAMSIEPKGAETVRLIFDMYVLEGLGVRSIAESLTHRNVLTGAGSSTWSGAAVLKILKNEKYCGDLKQRKTVTTDYLTHKKEKNRDKEDIIYLKDHHEPIINREVWNKAQGELSRRASGSFSPSHGSMYALSGKVFCAACGSVLFCRTRRRKDGAAYRVWQRRCNCILEHHQLREDDIASCIRGYIATVGVGKLLHGFSSILKHAVSSMEDDVSKTLTEISAAEKKRLKLADTYIAGDINREDYFKLYQIYETQLQEANETLHLLKEADRKDILQQLTDDVTQIIEGNGDDRGLYLGLVDKIYLRQDGGADIYLKYLTQQLRTVLG